VTGREDRTRGLGASWVDGRGRRTDHMHARVPRHVITMRRQMHGRDIAFRYDEDIGGDGV
jgi:hypothetical protein